MKVLLIGSGGREHALAQALEQLADPAKGRLLAWVLATGGDPFPPAEEGGLARIADGLRGFDDDPDQARFRVLLVVLTMLGDSLLGEGVRARLGLGPQDAPRFREWLLALLA